MSPAAGLPKPLVVQSSEVRVPRKFEKSADASGSDAGTAAVGGGYGNGNAEVKALAADCANEDEGDVKTPGLERCGRSEGINEWCENGFERDSD